MFTINNFTISFALFFLLFGCKKNHKILVNAFAVTFAATLYYKLTCSCFYGFNVCFNQLICKINNPLSDNFYGLLRIKNTTIIGLIFLHFNCK